jgi:hypothetical protein
MWIALGAAAAGVHFGLGSDSLLAEKIYSRGFFIAWRWAWDHTLGLSPFPWVYVFAAAVLLAAVLKLSRVFFRPRSALREPRAKRVGRAFLCIAGWAGKLVFFFYVLWGYNYNRIGVEKQLRLETPPLDAAARLSAESRASIPGISEAVLAEAALPANLESDIRSALAAVLREAGYPAPGRARVRTFFPGGWMMRFSSTGVYVPYFGEGYTAGNLLPFEKPFAMAHEMAHGYGITDEGAANFLAFLACAASPLPSVIYSGYAAYWEYAAGELPRTQFKALWDELPDGMKTDLRAAQENAARYRGVLERVSRKVYTRYLKSQGIQDGLRSYSRFVGLVAAWKKRAS